MQLFAWLCPDFLRVQAGALGEHRDPRHVAARMCYPYYQLWRAKLTRAELRARFPACPLLFMVRAERSNETDRLMRVLLLQYSYLVLVCQTHKRSRARTAFSST